MISWRPSLWANQPGLDRGSSAGLLDMIQNHTFVGLADATLALIQHGTRLYLMDTTAITKEMLYQQVGAPVILVCCSQIFCWCGRQDLVEFDTREVLTGTLKVRAGNEDRGGQRRQHQGARPLGARNGSRRGGAGIGSHLGFGYSDLKLGSLNHSLQP